MRKAWTLPGIGVAPRARVIVGLGAASLCLLLCVSASPIAARQESVPELPSVFSVLEGSWVGTGLLMGRSAAFKLTWEAHVGGFVLLTFSNGWVQDGGGLTPVLTAHATYLVDGSSAVGVWVDDRPGRGCVPALRRGYLPTQCDPVNRRRCDPAPQGSCRPARAASATHAAPVGCLRRNGPQHDRANAVRGVVRGSSRGWPRTGPHAASRCSGGGEPSCPPFNGRRDRGYLDCTSRVVGLRGPVRCMTEVTCLTQ